MVCFFGIRPMVFLYLFLSAIKNNCIYFSQWMDSYLQHPYEYFIDKEGK